MRVILYQCFFQLVSYGIDFFAGLTPQLDDEDGSGVALHKETVFLLLDVLFAEFQDVAVHQFDCGGMKLQGNQVAQETLLQSVAMGAHHHFLFGRQGVEVDFDFGDEGQGAFAACQDLTEVDGALLKRFFGMV